MDAAGLVVSGLVASYGANEPVLRGIDLVAKTGEVTAIIGPNGSGKSSSLKAVCGFMNRRGGTVHLNGVDITTMEPKDFRQQGVRFVPQVDASFDGMSVEDNLRLAGWALSMSAAESREALQQIETWFPVLAEKRKLLAGYLSGGERRQLEFARTAMGRPRLLLLDEPSAGLSPKMSATMYESIDRLRAADLVILLVDQNVAKAVEIADVVYEFSLGRVSRRMLRGDHHAENIVSEWLST